MRHAIASERALVLAPRGRDAPLAVAILAEAGVTALACPSVLALIRELDLGCGFVVATEEALDAPDLAPLDAWLRGQEEWSDLPFVLLTRGGGGLERNPAAKRYLDVLGNVAFLERPFHPTTLVSLARSALRGRRRQYEARARLAALSESETRFRNMADHAPVMTWVTDASGSCSYRNRRWYEFTGQTPSEAEGFGWLDAVYPDDRAWAGDTFHAANARQEAIRLEYRLRRHDGVYRWALDVATPRFGTDRKFLGYVGSVIDIDARRETEDALRESEERLRLAVDNAEIGFWDVDIVNDVLIWPPRVKAMFGISPDAPVTMRDFYAGLHPDDHDATCAAFAAACDPERRALYDVEYRTVGKEDGRIRFVAAKGGGVFNEDGRCVRVIGTALDVTERKRTQAALHESEKRLRTITNAVPAFVWFATPDGHVHYLNDRWFEYTGQTEAEALPDGWTDVLHPHDVERTAVAWEDARARGVTYQVEMRYRRRDGAYRWYVARAEPLRDAGGEITTWFGTSTDIHEQRLAIERLEVALDAGAIQGTWVWDVPGDRVTADDRFAFAFGIDPDECRAGFPIAKAVARIHEDDRDEVRRAISGALAAGGNYRCEYRVQNGDGVFRWVEASGRVEAAADGTPLRFAGVAVDVQERRQAEERMRLLAREVDHRAKNLLAVVQSVVQLTRSRDVGSFKSAVSGRIQALARAHSLLAESRWEGVNLGTLAREELAPFNRGGGERIRIDGPAVSLRPAASQALALVLHELATNGAKYGALSAEQGTLNVSWRFISSNGSRRLELVWQESGGPLVTPPSREGFGSTVVRTSVERQLDGEIFFDWAPGGVRCRIVVPADQLGTSLDASAIEPNPRAAEAAEVSLIGRRILIVEDEALIALELERAVASLGCEVVGPAGSSEAALDVIRNCAPDLAVLDVNLSGQRSDRVARALRALDIPFIYCTGYAEPLEHLSNEIDAEIIRKPVDPDLLARAFRRAL